MSPVCREHEEVYVVLRADLFHEPGTNLETLVTVREALRSQDLARREVARLNALHPDGQVRYWYAASRLFPPGRSASTVETSQ